MSVISERTGKKATASVIERFPLTLAGATKPPRAARASTVQPSYRDGTPILVNHRHAASPVFPPPIDDKQLRELERFKDWAKSAIQTQQNDIDRIGGAVDRMERDLKSFKTFMEEMHTELITHRQGQDSQKDEELGVLKEELHAIQAELNSNRQFRNSLKEEEFPVLQEDMDALRSELAQARKFQRELKDQDIKTLQQDIQGLRRSLEGMSYLTEGGPKVSQEKFETLVNDVREVNHKSNEIYTLRTDLGQFQTRVASMETAIREAEASIRKHVLDQAAGAASQNESGIIGSSTPRQLVRNNVERAHERREKRDQPIAKRRHSEMENNVDKSQGPPTKRPMHSRGNPSALHSPGNGASQSLTVGFRGKNSPIVLSSNHGTPSPILDRRGSIQSIRTGIEVINRSMNGPIDFNELDSLLDKSRPAPKPLSTGDIISSKAPVQFDTPNAAPKGLLRKSTVTSHTDTASKRRHNITTPLNQAQKSGGKPQKSVKAASNKENKKPRNFRDRSDTPDQLSTLSADEAMQKSVQRRPSGSTGVRRISKIFHSTAIAPLGKFDIILRP